MKEYWPEISYCLNNCLSSKLFVPNAHVIYIKASIIEVVILLYYFHIISINSSFYTLKDNNDIISQMQHYKKYLLKKPDYVIDLTVNLKSVAKMAHMSGDMMAGEGSRIRRTISLDGHRKGHTASGWKAVRSMADSLLQ